MNLYAFSFQFSRLLKIENQAFLKTVIGTLPYAAVFLKFPVLVQVQKIIKSRRFRNCGFNDFNEWNRIKSELIEPVYIEQIDHSVIAVSRIIRNHLPYDRYLPPCLYVCKNIKIKIFCIMLFKRSLSAAYRS